MLTLSDSRCIYRLCVASKDTVNVSLSVQALISCFGSNGCGVGTTDDAWIYFQKHGSVSGACYGPYTGTKIPCAIKPGATECPSGKGTVKYHKTNSTYQPGMAAAWPTPAIALDIYHNGAIFHCFSLHCFFVVFTVFHCFSGPVSASIQVFSDLQGYKKGVYSHIGGAQPEGGHAIKLLGWGTEAGVDYWLAANSWGASWGGLGGYFKIKKGTNECGVESLVHVEVLKMMNFASNTINFVLKMMDFAFK